jgi:hypothetical protein
MYKELVVALELERDRRNALPGDRVLLNPTTGGRFTRKKIYAHMTAFGRRSAVSNAHLPASATSFRLTCYCAVQTCTTLRRCSGTSSKRWSVTIFLS